jgi:hypothetical protein
MAALRNAVRAYSMAVQDTVRVKNRVKAMFRSRGIQSDGHPLHEGYQRMLQSGIKPNLAKLTLARRIAAIVLSMWKRQEVYDPERQKAVTDRR